MAMNVAVIGAGAAAAGPACPLVSDAFTYSNGSLDTVSSGVWDATNDTDRFTVTSGQVVGNVGSWASEATRNTASLGSVNQYVKVTVVATGPTAYPGVAFRLTNSTSAYYSFKISTGGDPSWSSCIASGGASTCTVIVAAGYILIENGDTIALTVEGTGDNTVVRAWKNQTADCPISSSEWDSGDNTPDVTYTTNPGANAVDTGNYAGLAYIQETANTAIMDNFKAGALP
jgi:hypothetical protein